MTSHHSTHLNPWTENQKYLGKPGSVYPGPNAEADKGWQRLGKTERHLFQSSVRAFHFTTSLLGPFGPRDAAPPRVIKATKHRSGSQMFSSYATTTHHNHRLIEIQRSTFVCACFYLGQHANKKWERNGKKTCASEMAADHRHQAPEHCWNLRKHRNGNEFTHGLEWKAMKSHRGKEKGLPVCDQPGTNNIPSSTVDLGTNPTMFSMQF